MCSSHCDREFIKMMILRNSESVQRDAATESDVGMQVDVHLGRGLSELTIAN